MNTGVHVSLSILVSLVYMPSSGIAGSYDSSIYSFVCLFVFVCFLRNLHSVLHSGCASLHSHQQCKTYILICGLEWKLCSVFTSSGRETLSHSEQSLPRKTTQILNLCSSKSWLLKKYKILPGLVLLQRARTLEKSLLQI